MENFVDRTRNLLKTEHCSDPICIVAFADYVCTRVKLPVMKAKKFMAKITNMNADKLTEGDRFAYSNGDTNMVVSFVSWPKEDDSPTFEVIESNIDIKDIFADDAEIEFIGENPAITLKAKLIRTIAELGSPAIDDMQSSFNTSLQLFTKLAELEKLHEDFTLSEVVRKITEYGKKHVAKICEFEQREFGVVDASNSKELMTVILAGSNMIATRSRIGVATDIIVSKYVFEKYVANKLQGLQVDEDAKCRIFGMLIHVLPDDVFQDKLEMAVYRKDDIGLRICYTDTKYGIIETGFFPESMFYTITLREDTSLND